MLGTMLRPSPVALGGLPWEAGGGAALGAPQTIAGLFAWYRADRLITTVGGAVSIWGDQVGGRTLTQGTGSAQPTHVPVTAAFNNQSTISCDGGDSVVAATASDWNFMHNGAGMTMVLVAKGAADNTTYSFCGTSTTTTTVGTRLRTSATGNLAWDAGNGTTNLFGGNVLVNADSALFKATVRYEEGRAGNEYATRANGSADTTGNSAAAPSASNATNPLTIGNAGALTLTGNVAELIIYSRYITDAEANAIDAYLLGRYGV